MIRYKCDYSIEKGGAIPDTGEVIDVGAIRIKFDYPMITFEKGEDGVYELHMGS